jgi:hypothetical protein
MGVAGDGAVFPEPEFGQQGFFSINACFSVDSLYGGTKSVIVLPVEHVSLRISFCGLIDQA